MRRRILAVILLVAALLASTIVLVRNQGSLNAYPDDPSSEMHFLCEETGLVLTLTRRELQQAAESGNALLSSDPNGPPTVVRNPDTGNLTCFRAVQINGNWEYVVPPPPYRIEIPFGTSPSADDGQEMRFIERS